MQTEDNKSLKDSGLNITKDFLAESIKHVSVQHRKKGGPYNKNERRQRRNEVFRLHFDHGYSAVKIADLMKINRNTVNNDINYWYSRLSKEWKSYDIDSWCMKQMHRFESQRTRLLEQLEKQQILQNKLTIERMIFEIDSKITQAATKFLTSRELVLNQAYEMVNDWLEEHKSTARVILGRDLMLVSGSARKKIDEIIKNDSKNKIGRM